jgi:hypothetical protein
MIVKLGTVIDKAVPNNVASKTANKLIEVNHTIETFTFSYLQNGFKAAVALDKFAELTSKRGLAPEEAAKIAAKFSNDMFGGQNWYRTMNESSNQVFRTFGNKLITGSGMGVMRIILFAPDWKFSTFRSIYKALPGVSPKEEQKLYGKYLYKSAIYNGIIANAINLTLTGRSIFTNRDPTRVELSNDPNGSTMQVAKHLTEFPEAMKAPIQFASNALNPSMKNIAEMFANRQYISFKGSPAIVRPSDTTLETIRNVAAKAASVFIPITAQQLSDPGKALTGFVGMPIYGRTETQQQEDRLKNIRDRIANKQSLANRRGESLNSKALDELKNLLGF